MLNTCVSVLGTSQQHLASSQDKTGESADSTKSSPGASQREPDFYNIVVWCGKQIITEEKDLRNKCKIKKIL